MINEWVENIYWGARLEIKDDVLGRRKGCDLLIHGIIITSIRFQIRKGHVQDARFDTYHRLGMVPIGGLPTVFSISLPTLIYR